MSPLPPTVLIAPVDPTLVRLGVGRVVVGMPWDLGVVSIVHVWPAVSVPGGWVRVPWPVEVGTKRFVAPVDLQIGHVLQVTAFGGWHCYGWIADADPYRFVLVPSEDAISAVVAATRAVEVWYAAELAAVEEAWSERIARVQRLHDEAG